jgi:thiol-disulfide isomerase/thioredoxin
MHKRRNTVIAIAAFAAALILISVFYNNFLKRISPDNNLSPKQQENSVEAPDFTVYDMDENKISFSDFKGEPIVINFWASWCPPCKAEMPDFEEMYQEYSAKGVVFIMVNIKVNILKQQ